MKPRGIAAVLSLALLPVLGWPARGAAEPSGTGAVSPKTSLAIGVAPFESVAAPGTEVPDVATLLADRLALRGVERVVGPASLGAPAVAKPKPEEIVAWASGGDLGAIVVGRTTRLGRSLSIDVRLRSAQDGRVVATYVEEVGRESQLGAAVERLSQQVLEGAERALAESLSPHPDGRSLGNAAGSADSGAEDAPAPRRGPISIRAQELEAFEKEGRKRLIFTGDVRATQEDLTLSADRLEAFYPKASTQPERLVATGHVVMVQEGKRARCDHATYFQAEQRIVCTGKAVLSQGDDRIEGREIVFDLDAKVLHVIGDAFVRIHPEEEPSVDGEAP